MRINYLINNLKRINKKLIIAAVVFFLLVGVTSFYVAKIKGDEYSKSLINQETATDSQPTENTIIGSEAIIEDLSNMQLPILMYHHIRDYNDSTDSIGTNLSVSPEKFSEQLDLIRSLGYQTITLSELKPSIDKPIILTFDDGYDNFYQNTYPELKKRGMVAVSFIIVNNIGKSNYMTEYQIKEINNNGIEIGSHTLSHPDLSVSNTTKQGTEIADSKFRLEQILGKTIDSICYPAGKYNTETINIVSSAGYKYAVTTKTGISKFSNLLELNRYRVNADTSISGYLK
ncbi:MAG: polysaccharide deacetylase family protein [Patescibacteria group bacterium]